MVDFALACVKLLGMMFYFDFPPTVVLIWFPLFLLRHSLTALGAGLCLSALNVQYRDRARRRTFPLSQIWLFSTPVAYPTPCRRALADSLRS